MYRRPTPEGRLERPPMALWRLIAPAPNSRSLLWWKPLALCHIIGVYPCWVTLAVADTTIHRGEILVEFVP